MIFFGSGQRQLRILAVVFILLTATSALYGREAQANSVLSRADEPITNAGYSDARKPSGNVIAERRFSVNIGCMILASLSILCALGLFASVRGIGEAIAEVAAIRLEATALITGYPMPPEKKKRMAGIKKRGWGLRLKLISFVNALVMIVVIMVSVPLYLIMTQSRQQTLLKGLWDRSTVLLEGLASSSRAYLPLRSILELGLLPGRMNSVPEARYITITGYSPDTGVFAEKVWATNDPDILRKINTVEFRPGQSRHTDTLSLRLNDIAGELNDRARAEAGGLSDAILSLEREGQELALRTDAASLWRLEDIQVQTRVLQARLGECLFEINKAIGSEPEFSPDRFVASRDNRYIFFKPIMYRQGSEDVYFRGMVRLEVSVDAILGEIAEGRRSLIWAILLIALAAQAVGVIGSLFASAMIVRPIRHLVRHAEIIRDAEDKAKLAGAEIKLNSNDEFAILGDAINEITRNLVKAAVTASAAVADLSVGKEIQKQFIPLKTDRNGNKLSHGSKETRFISFFGYYEGAKGASGDYFDYKDLDGRYYAIIKSDVAGKGIPAAFIMMQVATMFLNYFKQWKLDGKGMRIEELVYQINDFIETLAFKDRFAAFTLCLLDSQTGVVRFCNAGDNIIHLFDASEGKVRTLTLPETPAAGVLPNSMVESKSGYRVQTMTLDHGDILLLYTDGIEEAKRKFRDAEFRETLCTAGENGTPHENHVAGQGDEEMGPDRVQGIINAVMNKQVYKLHKWHNPEGVDKDLQFDFRDCQGTVEEVIMGMV
jgi:hypothetical protein